MVFTDPVDRDNIAVMEAGHRFRFPAESAKLFFGASDQSTDHLESNMPLQRLLQCLIDNSHASTTDFADQLKVAQRLGHGKHGR